jgi:hypothetical protein
VTSGYHNYAAALMKLSCWQVPHEGMRPACHKAGNAGEHVASFSFFSSKTVQRYKG